MDLRVEQVFWKRQRRFWIGRTLIIVVFTLALASSFLVPATAFQLAQISALETRVSLSVFVWVLFNLIFMLSVAPLGNALWMRYRKAHFALIARRYVALYNGLYNLALITPQSVIDCNPYFLARLFTRCPLSALLATLDLARQHNLSITNVVLNEGRAFVNAQALSITSEYVSELTHMRASDWGFGLFYYITSVIFMGVSIGAAITNLSYLYGLGIMWMSLVIMPLIYWAVFWGRLRRVSNQWAEAMVSAEVLTRADLSALFRGHLRPFLDSLTKPHYLLIALTLMAATRYRSVFLGAYSRALFSGLQQFHDFKLRISYFGLVP